MDRRDSLPKPGVSIVFPCLNEEKCLPAALNAAASALSRCGVPGEIVVSDNGSTDRSVAVAEGHGARVVHAPIRGYGGALSAGISQARYDMIVFADPDGSYPLERIPALIAPLKDGSADFVLGSRMLGKIERDAMPFLNRHLGTPILSFIVRLLHGLPVSDCNSGMRAITAAAYERLQMKCPGMEFASEMLVKAAMTQARYREIPIVFRKDKRGRPPHLRPWRDGWRHLRLLLAFAPAATVILLPAVLSMLLFLGIAYVLLYHYWNPQTSLRFHTAFILLGLNLPLIVGSISLVLAKISLVKSGNPPEMITAAILKVSERGWFFFLSTVCYLVMMAGICRLFWGWYCSGFADLFAIGSLIQIVSFSLLGTALATLDIGIGAIDLIPIASGGRPVSMGKAQRP